MNPFRDKSTVTPEGVVKTVQIDGVMLRRLVTHVDERGSMLEVNNNAWDINETPLVAVSVYSIRPGKIKGWVVHHEQDDRNCLLNGRVKWVLYDARQQSPTHGQISEITISDYQHTLIVIPRGVYHAVQNIGDVEAFIIDMPSVPYDHENPDKYRLPLDNDVIPYRFSESRGW